MAVGIGLDLIPYSESKRFLSPLNILLCSVKATIEKGRYGSTWPTEASLIMHDKGAPFQESKLSPTVIS